MTTRTAASKMFKAGAMAARDGVDVDDILFSSHVCDAWQVVEEKIGEYQAHEFESDLVHAAIDGWYSVE